MILNDYFIAFLLPKIWKVYLLCLIKIFDDPSDCSLILILIFFIPVTGLFSIFIDSLESFPNNNILSLIQLADIFVIMSDGSASASTTSWGIIIITRSVLEEGLIIISFRLME